MGRGKIEIKKIENPTNRQVTYSKRRNGMFKKAQELTVLCDAKVSLIMFSKSGKFHEFISPNTTTKRMIDQYQRTVGIDVWSSHYQRMQESLRKLMEMNNKLRREIRQRIGEDLDGLDIQELHVLEQEMASAAKDIRERKFHVMKTQIDTCRKKVKSMQERQGNLLLELETRYDDPQPGRVESEGDYESGITFASGASNLYTFRVHQSHLDLNHGGVGLGLGDLRLA